MIELGLLAMTVEIGGPWLIHMACVAIVAAAIGWFVPWFTAAVTLSYVLGSAGAFLLTGTSQTGSFYWEECFWEPIFDGRFLSFAGEDGMGLLLAWLLPLAISLTVIVFVKRLKLADGVTTTVVQPSDSPPKREEEG